MQDFRGKIAVVTGGGTGMGRELAKQLAADGCHVAMCDVSPENMEASREACNKLAPSGTRITTHECDVSVEAQVQAFCEAVKREHSTDHINLLFNNAGIGGGGSFVVDDREEWDKTFEVCWGGVYYCARAFVPLLIASSEGHIVNTSSVNGFWASLGPMTSHTAYSAAKFAVKGFTEALLTDMRLNAPHVGVSLVMPGHIGTSIIANSARVLGRPSPKEMTEEDLLATRDRMERMGLPAGSLDDEQIRKAMQQRIDDFRDKAPTSAAEAATMMLDGVREGSWRILLGKDAHQLDQLVREFPEEAYELSFAQRMRSGDVLSNLTADGES
jgi:NAD(P)-dependent dehydrogenase (short-subunit alcohol dehydrogenase family)